jgi:GNAT superfamily N-acetyltransferase
MGTDGEAARRDLGGGLVLRRATAADTEARAAFNAAIFGEPGAPNEGSVDWTRDLMGGDHPTCAGDFTLVEDTRRGSIVSSVVLIGQTWSYDGVEFGVGRPELVGTHPEYRRRGLIRAQFDVIHAWSAARGQRLQAITGLPGFYRQFGYEMALQLGGCRHGYPQLVPRLKEGQMDPYHVRPVTEPDLPFIAQVYREATRRVSFSRRPHSS